MRWVLCAFWVHITAGWAAGQGYVSYFTGNPSDAVTAPPGGVCLMGGASEDDQAMTWFLERVDGGDVLVLRASGSDGYNNYLFNELGVDLNSVETLVFSGQAAAYLPEVHERIQRAEGIWFAGGDQWDYVQFWRDTPVADLINEGIAERNVVVGGTSAGMAILGGHYFSAANGTVTSATALNAPYDGNVTVDSAAFLHVPFLEEVVTDTHYDSPDRKGRHVVFLARTHTDYGALARGIACDEYTAVCVDETGWARVFGEHPTYDDNAYFLAPNCEVSPAVPEACTPGAPLDWNLAGQAVAVYHVKGTPDGANGFDLNDWQSGIGGNWMRWWAESGSLFEAEADAPDCTSAMRPSVHGEWMAYPNPASDRFKVVSGAGAHVGEVWVVDGRGAVHRLNASALGEVDAAGLANGLYHWFLPGFPGLGGRVVIRH